MPGRALKIVPTAYAMCSQAWELEIDDDGRWFEVLAWGVLDRIVRPSGRRSGDRHRRWAPATGSSASRCSATASTTSGRSRPPRSPDHEGNGGVFHRNGLIRASGWPVDGPNYLAPMGPVSVENTSVPCCAWYRSCTYRRHGDNLFVRPAGLRAAWALVAACACEKQRAPHRRLGYRTESGAARTAHEPRPHRQHRPAVGWPASGNPTSPPRPRRHRVRARARSSALALRAAQRRRAGRRDQRAAASPTTARASRAGS